MASSGVLNQQLSPRQQVFMNQKLLQMQSVNKEWLKHKKDIEEIIEQKNYHLKSLVEKVFEAADYNKSGTLS